ncbi:hypothetical protein ACIBG0_37145 [Nocardia sp. NPDC050630]|uniref:hypothetical protein n=1 Tax=Nocardia sp. NPDC050630 TaxID=3364321 RepID=UPI00379E3BBF
MAIPKVLEPQPDRSPTEPTPATETETETETAERGLDARYEQLRHAALHARAQAFPLGFAVLTRRGVIAWRCALARIAVVAPAAPPRAAAGVAVASLSSAITAELVDALAGLALIGT